MKHLLEIFCSKCGEPFMAELNEMAVLTECPIPECAKVHYIEIVGILAEVIPADDFGPKGPTSFELFWETRKVNGMGDDAVAKQIF